MSENEKAGGVDVKALRAAVGKLVEGARPRLVRLWTYYQNPLRTCAARSDGQGSDRPYRQGQEWGMPSRITGFRSGMEVGAGQDVEGVARKEVVVENDIGWRVDTMVEYLFGKPITLHSTVPDPARREEIGRLLRLILAGNGGILFLQQMALVGCVYGFVDVMVKFDPKGADENEVTGFGGVQDLGAPTVGGVEEARPASGAAKWDGELERIARTIRLEIVEPARAVPFVSGEDWRKLEAYGQTYEVKGQKSEVKGGKGWLRGWLGAVVPDFSGASELGVEVVTAGGWRRFVGEKVVAGGGEYARGVAGGAHTEFAGAVSVCGGERCGAADSVAG